MTANLIGFVIVLGLTPVLEGGDLVLSFGILACVLLVGEIFMCFVRL